MRTAVGVAMLAFLGTLYLAAYYDEVGLSLTGIWLIVLAVPIAAGIITAMAVRGLRPGTRFDPRADPLPGTAFQAAGISPSGERAMAPTQDISTLLYERRITRGPAITGRGERARDNVVYALHELGELAPLVRQLDDEDQLLEVLDYVDGLHAALKESNDTLLADVRAEQSEGVDENERPAGENSD
jgi:hypothetical protein